MSITIHRNDQPVHTMGHLLRAKAVFTRDVLECKNVKTFYTHMQTVVYPPLLPILPI